MCGGTCTSTQEDPMNCGQCGTQCRNDQACLAGQCTCRPGLTLCNGQCVDLVNNGNNCGACGVTCGQGIRCVNGVCPATQGCPAGQVTCDRACFTQAELASSPLHCTDQPFSCGNQCQADELCVQGQCAQFFVSQACTTCPCPACGSGTTCCQYPGTTEAVCVSGTTCPQ
jgi:hypothetical protein